MTIQVDSTDLVNMVCGTDPSYKLHNHEKIKNVGDYRGGFNDYWVWNRSRLQKLSNTELYDIYQLCKNS